MAGPVHIGKTLGQTFSVGVNITEQWKSILCFLTKSFIRYINMPSFHVGLLKFDTTPEPPFNYYFNYYLTQVNIFNMLNIN